MFRKTTRLEVTLDRLGDIMDNHSSLAEGKDWYENATYDELKRLVMTIKASGTIDSCHGVMGPNTSLLHARATERR